ncbi:GntR family transcriptional regulator [Microbacterium sp. A82]|uniref:GntR family transcriptional regulator n=1 Tax=unclassified Microbacterium TaxID=2609290 RepID=UPI003F3570ED
MTKTLSKSQRAYDWLKERIAGQTYTPGYRLVLGTIAGELDMSVVPVREAIRQLEAEGLVHFEHNVGARVAMVDDAQYRHSMETLSILEGSATALAARHLTADDLKLARAINAQMIETLENFNPSAFTQLNQRFHAALIAPCPNPRLHELVTLEMSRLNRLRDSTFSFVPGRAHDSVREHEQIVALIENSAPITEIERAARLHHASTLDAYLTQTQPDEAVGTHVH